MKSIPGYEDLYAATEDGRIWSYFNNRFLVPKNNGKDYFYTDLSKNGKKKRYYIHRVIAFTFIPNPENKPEVNHKNGIKTDNRVENLEWVTHSENNKHAWKNGLKKTNEKRFKIFAEIGKLRRKLTAEQVLEIRNLHSSQRFNQHELAKIFNISVSNINNVVNYKSYVEVI